MCFCQTKLLLCQPALLAHLLLHADEAPGGRVFPGVKPDLPIHKGKQCMVGAHAYIGAWMEFSASLPDNDVSSRAGLATIELDAEHLGQGATSVLC